MPIVFVFEGGDRGYRYLLDGWKEEAERKGFMLFIPHFDLKSLSFGRLSGGGG